MSWWGVETSFRPVPAFPPIPARNRSLRFLYRRCRFFGDRDERFSGQESHRQARMMRVWPWLAGWVPVPPVIGRLVRFYPHIFLQPVCTPKDSVGVKSLASLVCCNNRCRGGGSEQSPGRNPCADIRRQNLQSWRHARSSCLLVAVSCPLPFGERASRRLLERF